MDVTAASTEIIFVRHGETESNTLGLLHGRTDSPLSETGRRQAARVAARMACETSVRAIYSSPLARALVTAETIGHRLSIIPIVRPDLAELDFGDIEGYTPARLADEYPELFARFQDWSDVEAAFPNGESRGQFHRRVHDAIDDLSERHLGQRFIVVAHGGVIASAVAQLSGDNPNDYQRYMVRNCSVTQVDIATEGIAVSCWDDVSHLADQAGDERCG